MGHELKREFGGKNECGFIRPACSCGWVGDKHYAYEDYQHHHVQSQERKHMHDSKEN